MFTAIPPISSSICPVFVFNSFFLTDKVPMNQWLKTKKNATAGQMISSHNLSNECSYCMNMEVIQQILF